MNATAMPRIAGAVVDPLSGRLVILSERGGEVDLHAGAETLAWALWLVYSGKELAFSLDAADRANPEGAWLKAVDYPQETASSSIGKTLLEADLVLKTLAFGVRPEGARVVERPPGLLPSVPQMMMEGRPRTSKGEWARMFIVVDAMELSGTDRVVRFDVARMAVRARRQMPDRSSPTGLRDVDTDPDSIEARFARRATALYDQLAATEAPEFERVRQIAKSLAIATWLKNSGARIDVGALVPILNRTALKGVDRISALDVTWLRTKSTPFADRTRSGEQVEREQIRIFGGVDLAVKPQVLAAGAC